jgi:hypothetical protein
MAVARLATNNFRPLGLLLYVLVAPLPPVVKQDVIM